MCLSIYKAVNVVILFHTHSPETKAKLHMTKFIQQSKLPRLSMPKEGADRELQPQHPLAYKYCLHFSMHSKIGLNL